MDKRLYTVEEAAGYLAVSTHTLYHWVCKRSIPFVKLRKKALRFDKKDLDSLIDGLKTKAGKEVEADGTIQARKDLVASVLS